MSTEICEKPTEKVYNVVVWHNHTRPHVTYHTAIGRDSEEALDRFYKIHKYALVEAVIEKAILIS